MGQKRSVLIVDDDVDSSQMVKILLERTGLYTVSVCNRGSEAYKVIQEKRPEMVLLDIVMPDVDGGEVASQIQNDKTLGKTKIVFMTSLVSQKEIRENDMIGGHPFIPKPVSAEILLKRVKELFEAGNEPPKH